MAASYAATVAQRGAAIGNKMHDGLDAFMDERYEQALFNYLVAAEAGSATAQANVDHLTKLQDQFFENVRPTTAAALDRMHVRELELLSKVRAVA